MSHTPASSPARLKGNPCRHSRAAADSPAMPSAAAPSGLDDRPSAAVAPRRSRPSGRKNAHRGLAACRRAASGKSRSQALIASGKTPRSPTTARRSHLLQQSNPAQTDYPTVIVPGLSVTVSSTTIQDTSTIDTGLWDMSGGYESALDSEVNNVLSKAHGKGERGFTGKPEFKPKPGKLPKGVRPSSANPGQFEVKNPQTGTWVLKPPGWSPNVGMVGGIGVLGVLGTMAAGCFESGACEAAALAF